MWLGIILVLSYSTQILIILFANIVYSENNWTVNSPPKRMMVIKCPYQKVDRTEINPSQKYSPAKNFQVKEG